MLVNQWYVAATSAELAIEPLGRVICGRHVALFRNREGVACAVVDVCSHRRAPLSAGLIVEGAITCPYHGLRFNGEGQCVYVPNQSKILEQQHIAHFPVKERFGMIWLFPGDPAQAEATNLPDLPWREDPTWNTKVVQSYPIAAPAQLIADNLLDLSHVAFVHTKTIGFSAALLASDPLVTTVEGNTIRNVRVFPDVEPPPTHRAWGKFKGKVTRTSSSEWSPPGRVSILVRNEDENAKLDVRFDHFVTPETEATHRYYVAIARNFMIDDDTLTHSIDVENNKVHEEDREIVELQYRNMVAHPDVRDVALVQDRPLYLAHRILRKLESEESAELPRLRDPASKADLADH